MDALTLIQTFALLGLRIRYWIIIVVIVLVILALVFFARRRP